MTNLVDLIIKKYFGSCQWQNYNASTIFKWIKITGLFYYNYYQFHDPSMLLMEGNTMIILDTLKNIF